MVIQIRNIVYVDFSHYLVILYGGKKKKIEHNLYKAYLHTSVVGFFLICIIYNFFCFLLFFPLGRNTSLQEIHGT